MIRNPFATSESGLLRRIPIVFHVLLVGSILALFQITGEQFKGLLRSFNDSANMSWGSLSVFLILVCGYVLVLLLLACTKILVEWLVDGK